MIKIYLFTEKALLETNNSYIFYKEHLPDESLGDDELLL